MLLLKIALVWEFGLGLSRAALAWDLPRVARRARLCGPVILISLLMYNLGAAVARPFGGEGRHELVGLVFLPFGIVMVACFVYFGTVLWQATIDDQ
jgi:hypothetical protein